MWASGHSDRGQPPIGRHVVYPVVKMAFPSFEFVNAGLHAREDTVP